MDAVVVAIDGDEDEIATDVAIEMFAWDVAAIDESVVEVANHAERGMAAGVKDLSGSPSVSWSMDESMINTSIYFQFKIFYFLSLRSIRL